MENGLAFATGFRLADEVILMLAHPALRRLIVSSGSRVFLPAALFLLLCSPARPDGYPFSTTTQRVFTPTLRLKLTPEQTQEIAATGTLTFGEEDLRLLRRHYPAATARADVITTTYNDSVEDPAAVLCLWVAPDEVAITLDEKHPPDEPPFAPPMKEHFPTDAELKGQAERHLRLGPDGTLYFRGKSITLQQAFALVDEIASVPKPAPGQEGSWNGRWLYVVVPPPRGEGEWSGDDEGRPTPLQVYEALTVYGTAKAVQVGREW